MAEAVTAVTWLAVAFLAVEVATTLVVSVGGYWGDVMAARMRTILSTRYFEQLLHLPQRYFDTAITGRVVNRLNRTINEITQFLQFFANNAFTMLVTTAAVLVITAFYWWPLAILLAVVFPVYMWLTARTSAKWQVWEGEKNTEVDVASGRFAEVVSQMSVVRAYNRQDHELTGFRDRFLRTVEITRQQSRFWHGMDAGRRLALNVAFGAMYLIVFVRTAQGLFSVGDMVILLQLMNMARQPIFSMSFLVDSAQRAVAGSKDYFEVLAEERERAAGRRSRRRARVRSRRVRTHRACRRSRGPTSCRVRRTSPRTCRPCASTRSPSPTTPTPPAPCWTACPSTSRRVPGWRSWASRAAGSRPSRTCCWACTR